MKSQYVDDLNLAKKLANKADKITCKWFRSNDLRVEDKSDLSPVTQADKLVEKMIRKIVAEKRPLDVVFGEEFGGASSGHRRWIIDPIDSTKNYAHGNPVYGTLIALEEGGKLIVSVVSAPQLGKRWWASLGGGSYCNGTRIRVSKVTTLKNAFLSYGSLSYWQTADKLDNLIHLIDVCGRQRAFGDFWQHMLVAEGAVDIALEQGQLKIWDMAAPRLIVQEAGGSVTTLNGTTKDDGSMITTNGLLHKKAIRVLAIGK